MDTSFLSGLSGANSTVSWVVVQTDGRIVVGGGFSIINGTFRTGIARLNSNGSLDGSFIPGNYSLINAVAVQSDNKVILSNGGSTGPGTVYRLNADGTVDTAFTTNSSGPSGSVNAIAVQPDGKIIVGGSFSSYGGVGRNNIARLNADGTLDSSFAQIPPGSFNGGVNNQVRCIQIQSDGKILVGGDFTTAVGVSRNHIARLTSTGTLDTNYVSNGGVSGPVYALALQSDNSFLAGGNFSLFFQNNLVSYDLARFYPDGSTDPNFIANFNNTVFSLAVQSDGGILAGGAFNIFNNNITQYALARVYGNLYPPQFLAQPTNRVAAVGTNVTFTALVSNPTLTYFQWRKNGNDLPGANGISYSLFNVQLSDAGAYSVFASNAYGGVSSTNGVLQVGIPPAITQQPVSLIVTQGQAASFTVAASGTPLSYTWRKNSAPIPGATNPTLTFASAVFTNAGSYNCLVTNFLGLISSASATLTVSSPPAIVTQPVNQTVGAGSNFTLSVTANGSTPLGYQWQKDGSPLPNLTNSSFTITNAQTTDSGGYSVVISNTFGSITSTVATVSVTYYPPVIVTQPVGGVYLVGTNFNLTVNAYGTPAPAYQWLTNGQPIAGATTATYPVINAQTNDSGSYSVLITNLGGSVTSTVAGVSVGFAPVILQSPQAFTNALGTSNVFDVTVSGSEPLVYQWFKDGLALAAATNRQLILPALQTNQIGYYSLAVTNLFGSALSSNALLNISNVDLAFQYIGLLAYYPFDGSWLDATVNHLDFNGNGQPSFGTNRFGTDQFALLSTNSSSIGTANMTLGQSGVSASFWLKLTQPPSASGEWALTQGSWYPKNGRFNFAVWADGHISVDFGDNPNFGSGEMDSPAGAISLQQWYHIAFTEDGSAINLLINGASLGTTAMPLAPRTAPLAIGGESGHYFNSGLIDDLRIYSRALSTNEVAQLYAYEAGRPVISLQPQSQTVLTGGTATFTTSAISTKPLSYQWFKEGTLLNNATNPTLVLTNVQAGQGGNYQLAVFNAAGGVSSSVASLAVIAPLVNGLPGCASNQFGFAICGSSGSNFVVEFSTNLQTWTALSTNTFGTNAFQFIDPGSTTNPLRFYRTRY